MQVIIYGFISFISQVTLIREIIASFHAGEFFLSFTIGWWIISTAVTSYISKTLIKTKADRFLLLFHILSPLIISVQVSLIKISKSLISPLGEATPLFLSIIISILAIFIYTIPSGIYFQKSSQDDEKEKTKKIYLFDCLGFGLAAILMYLFNKLLTPYTIITTVFIANIIAIKTNKKYLISLSIIFLISVFIIFKVNNYITLNKKPLNFFDTPYGRIELYEYNEEKYIYYNSTRILTDYDEINVRKAVASLTLIPENTKTILCISNSLSFCKKLAENSNSEIIQINQDKYLISIQKKIMEIPPNLKHIYVNPIKFFSTLSKDSFTTTVLDTSLPTTPSESIIFSNNFIRDIKKNIGIKGVYINTINYPQTPTSHHKRALSVYISKLKHHFENIEVFYDDFIIIASSDINIKKQIDKTKKFDERYINYLSERKITVKPIEDEKIMSIYKSILFAEVSKENQSISKILENILKPTISITLIILFFLFNLFIEKEASKMIMASFILLFIQITSIFIYQLIYGDIYKDITLILASVMIGMYIGISLKKEIEKIMVYLIFLAIVLVCILQSKLSLIIMVLISAVLCGKTFRNVSIKKGIISYIYDSIGATSSILIFEIWITQINDIRIIFLPVFISGFFLLTRK